MNSASKFLIALLAAVTAVSLYLAFADDSPSPRPQPQTNNEDVSNTGTGTFQSRGADNTTRTETNTSNENRQPVREVDAGPKDPGQGLVGRVVDSRQQPIADAYVVVFDGSVGGLAAMVMAQKDGVVRRPISETRTDEFGDFKLPIYEIKPNSPYEVYVIDDLHADLNRRGVIATPGEYVDIGLYEMLDGQRMTGMVRAKDTGLPIAGATVQMIPPNFSFKSAIVPGRELSTAYGLPNVGNSMTGIEVQTDPTGRFEIPNAPNGAVRLVAFAEGYAKQEKQNVLLDSETVIEFELGTGLEIAGMVIDSNEEPIAGAKITVAALSQVNPGQAEGLSDKNGQFRIQGLEEGPYRILVAASGFMRPEALPPIEAGTLDEVLVLERQGEVLLTVRNPSGRAMRTYQVMARRFNVQSNRVGHSLGAEVYQVTDRDLDGGKFRMSGLDPGTYKAEVVASGYSMSYSEAFEIVRGGPPAEVTCILSAGGELEGVVTSPTGQPLQGAIVETRPNEFVDLGANNFLSAMMVWDVTRARQTTGANGRFVLKKLTPGMYQLKVSHPDWSSDSVQNLEVRDGDRTAAGEIALIGGTRVSGIAYLDGQPAGQIQVTVTGINEPGQSVMPFNASTISGPDGSFTVPQLVRPGRYRIAAKRAAVDPSNIFSGIVDMQQTQQEIEFLEGQTTYEINFQIKTN